MKAIWIWIQAMFAVVGGLIGWLNGPCDGFLYALITFVILDYLSGVLCAIIDKKLSSEIGARGIVKKIFIFVLVGVAHILDSQIFGYDNNIIRTAVISFFLSNEGLSIIENASYAGLPIPQKLKDVLAQLHGRNNEPPSKGDEND